MFTYVLYGLAGAGLAISFYKDCGKTKPALKKAWRAFENILPQFLSILVVIGLALAILSPQTITNLLGTRSGIWGVLAAAIIGSITLIPGFVAFPLAAALLKNGAGYMQIVAFVSTLMMVGIVTLPIEIKPLESAPRLSEYSGFCVFLSRCVCDWSGAVMKAFIKRYRVFLLLFLANIVIGILMPDIGLSSASITIRNLLEMVSIIPPIFILLGLLDVWVDRATMMKYTGKGSGLKGILIAFVLGSAAAGPLYAAFPIAGIMLKKGSSLFNVFIFIGAWSTTKIPMLTFEAANLGFAFTLTRLALSIAGILIIAAATGKALGKEQQKQIYDLNQ